MASDKVDGETGVLQLNIGSSPSDWQILCRGEGCSEIYCLCMSGRLLEQVAMQKNYLLAGLLLCEAHQKNFTYNLSTG